jgi:hypothetical protein
MADMQNLVERLERAVGRLEAVSHTSDMHRGYGDSSSKGKQSTAQECLCNVLVLIFYHSNFSSLGLTSPNT